MPSNCTFELLLVEWSDQKILRAEPYRFFFPANVLYIGEQNNRQFGTQPAQPPKNVQSVGIAARQIEQQQVRHGTGLNALKRFPSATCGFQVPRIGLSD